MMPKQTGEPDLALAGLALLIIFGLMIWHDRPIQSPRPYDATNQQLHDQRITNHSYESWLWQDPFGFDTGENQVHNKLHEIFNLNNTDQDSSIKGNGINDYCYCHNGLLTKEIAKIAEDKDKNLQILISPVNIRPNTVENRELRTRHRYAVITGLIESGYRPSEPTKLNFCSTKKKSQKKEDSLRWEQYTKEDKNIIVVWTSSDKAKLVMKNIRDSASFRNYEFFTLDPTKSYLSHKPWQDHPTLPGKSDTHTNEMSSKSKTTPPSKLIYELIERRNINNPSNIAIISEQDTPRVQNMAKQFRESFCKSYKKKNEEDCNPDEIKNITYLKGLDAYQQIIGNQSQSANYLAEKKQDERLTILDQHNFPSGSNQFDYLHRLAVEIKRSHRNSDPEKRINAVGVFGSDFYDKLIIFKALRAEVPNILLFTTDLDAEMYQPQHWRWTRNLIVASDFELRLHEDLQKKTPPFRDSQQTKIFYYIFKEFGDNQNFSNADNPKPLIFEIGRNGLVSLGEQNTMNSRGILIHPIHNNLEQLNAKLLLWLLITIVLIFTVQQIKPNSGVLVVWLSTTAIIIFVVIFYAARQKTGDPLSLTEGVSVWPSMLIRLFALALAIAFIYKTICILEANFCRLTRQEFPDLEMNRHFFTSCTDNSPDSEKEIMVYVKILFLYTPNDISNSISKYNNSLILFSIFLVITGTVIYAHIVGTLSLFASTISIILLLLYITLFYVWLTFTLKIFLVSYALAILSFLFFIAYQIITTKSENIEQIRSLTISLLFLIGLIISQGSEKIKSIQRWIQEDTIRNLHSTTNSNQGRIQTNPENRNNRPREIIFMETLWQEYRQHGLIDYRLIRTSLKFLFFLIFTAALYHLFPISPSPCRGETCAQDEAIQIISLSVIMFLTFLVLDAQRLCLHWIEKVRTKHPLLVDETTLGSNPDERQIVVTERSDYDALESIKAIVFLVARRTRVVDKLIYYPLIVIMLMLFARINYFDNMDFPHSIGIVFTASISLLLYSGLKLRSEANKLRLTVIKQSKNLSFPVDTEKVTMIKEILAINYGAFEPLLEQPAMRALLLTLASLGLFAGEYIMLFW